MNLDKRKKELDKCKKFLEINGWKSYPDFGGYDCYSKNNELGIDINLDEIIIIYEEKELELPLNYYALLGVLLENIQTEFKIL